MKKYFSFLLMTLFASCLYAQSDAFKLTDTIFTINSVYTSSSGNVYNSCNQKFNSEKIDSLKKFLRANPTIHIQIEWYTDQRGSSEYNKLLSERSATILKKCLTDSIITENRVSTIGYGENNLIYTDAAIELLKTSKEKENAYFINRRVVIRIIKL
jgi:outer membrane protein OmpA-like peptidoglycan-associated protein